MKEMVGEAEKYHLKVAENSNLKIKLTLKP